VSQLNNGIFKKDKDDEIYRNLQKEIKVAYSNYFDKKYATVEKLLKI
jgi:hypothetical protein